MAEDSLKKRLSMEDIIDAMSEIANDPDDRDRFKALKALSGMNSGTVVLPPPMTTEERIERLARLMKALSRDQVKMAYRHAWPQVKDEVTGPVLGRLDDALTPEESRFCNKVTTVKLLYKRFPELKKDGQPRGYPKDQGAAAVADFCRKEARLALIHRKRADLGQPTD